MANMASRKRKRKQGADSGASADGSAKRARPASAPTSVSISRAASASEKKSTIKQDLLALYYPCVQSLRSYLLSKLPTSSRIRRKRLVSYGRDKVKIQAEGQENTGDEQKEQPRDALEELLTRILDTTLVAYADVPAAKDKDIADQTTRRVHDLDTLRTTFSQSKKTDESNVTISNASSGPFSRQAETVDFVVWLLFTRDAQASVKRNSIPDNVLCFGFQRSMPHGHAHGNDNGHESKNHKNKKKTASCTIPGLYTSRRPQNAQCLKELPWPQLLALLGAAGEQIMTDMLMNCSLYMAVDAGRGNYLQVTGKPVFSLRLPELGKPLRKPTASTEDTQFEKQPSDILLVRSRLFYAKPTVTSKDTVQFGLNHIYALNRYPYHKTLPKVHEGKGTTLEDLNRKNNTRMAMYIFPRQFGLHNAFTSPVDKAQTSQRLMDYTLREAEITAKFGDSKADKKVPIPKRLRGELLVLVERLRIRHAKCAYAALLELYCPASKRVGDDSTKFAGDGSPLVDLAVPLAQVTAFCQAAILKVFPGEFWGSGDVRKHNKAVILQRVDTFIHLLRYESQSLHGLLQGLKIAEIDWLAPPGLRGAKMGKTDLEKRQQIFAELVYYLFDSFLIPLIRSNFYVTESNTHRNRIFYYRHDVWRRIAEPALDAIKTDRLEEVSRPDAERIIESRRLGCAQIRLLPKNTAMRTVTNLSRRVKDRHRKQLLPSTNAMLEPVAAMFNYEMAKRPHLLGASMMSMQAIYARLVEFRGRFGQKQPALYFAKVDVKSAFDTIPQDAMVTLMRRIPTHQEYTIAKHTETTAAPPASHNAGIPGRKWRSIAKPASDTATFHEAVESAHAPSKKNTVFTETAFRSMRNSADLVGLAAHHVKQHIVRIGKKYYRQKEGIPQGSVLSSLLCSYFYADMEKTQLTFLNDSEDCLLLRLIDDFLLITTDRSKAARFVETMHRGHPAYGIQVNPTKSLVNFNLVVDGLQVPHHPPGSPFPYCGLYINTSNLNLTKDRETKKHVVFDSLTVERTSAPGDKFKRKTLLYFKLQASTMLYDMSFNSRRTALHNLHSALAETASRMWAYARCMPRGQRPGTRLTISTIDELAVLAFAVLSSPNESRGPDYKFTISQVHLKLILLHAFKQVLSRKQTAYKEVLAWIKMETQALKQNHHLSLPKTLN